MALKAIKNWAIVGAILGFMLGTQIDNGKTAYQNIQSQVIARKAGQVDAQIETWKQKLNKVQPNLFEKIFGEKTKVSEEELKKIKAKIDKLKEDKKRLKKGELTLGEKLKAIQGTPGQYLKEVKKHPLTVSGKTAKFALWGAAAGAGFGLYRTLKKKKKWQNVRPKR